MTRLWHPFKQHFYIQAAKVRLQGRNEIQDIVIAELLDFVTRISESLKIVKLQNKSNQCQRSGQSQKKHSSEQTRSMEHKTNLLY